MNKSQLRFCCKYPWINYFGNNKLDLQFIVVILHWNNKWPSFCKCKRYPVSQENLRSVEFRMNLWGHRFSQNANQKLLRITEFNWPLLDQKNFCKLFFTYISFNAPNNSRSSCICRFYNDDGNQVQQDQSRHLYSTIGPKFFLILGFLKIWFLNYFFP